MREIQLNGYIDEDVWFGDEITPGTLHDELYKEGTDKNEDIRIILNSYGGSCNAATRMYDELRNYPGKVHVIISGTAASAATVLAMAADRLEMTPGSLYMIHDPLMGVYGNEADLMESIRLLQVCKESIINIYRTRSWRSREDLAVFMSQTTWMDANDAQENGFIDSVMDGPSGSIDDVAFIHAVNQEEAEAKVRNWVERHKPIRKTADCVKPEEAEEEKEENLTPSQEPEPNPKETVAEETTVREEAQNTKLDAILGKLDRLDETVSRFIESATNKGTPAAQLEKRLSLLYNHR